MEIHNSTLPQIKLGMLQASDHAIIFDKIAIIDDNLDPGRLPIMPSSASKIEVLGTRLSKNFLDGRTSGSARLSTSRFRRRYW